MKFSRLAGFVVVASLGFLAGCSSNSSSNNDNPQIVSELFVATQGDNKVSIMSVDADTGHLTASGTGVATGSLPTAMLLAPDGNTLYVLNQGSADISVYTVGSDGKLTASGATVPTQGTNPVSMTMDAAAKFLFVLNQGDMFSSPPVPSTIAAFTVSGGTLTSVGAPFPAADDTVSIAVTPDSKFLYAANRLDGTVSPYAVDSSGVLTALGPIVPVGISPSAVTVTPNGNFLYVANSGSNNVSAFVICDNVTSDCLTPDGSLTEVDNSPFAAQTEPTAMIVDPTSTFMYVANKGSNQVSSFKIGQVSGALSLLATNPNISTGATPVALAIPPKAQYLYVANSGGSSVSVLAYDATSGVLTLRGAPAATGTTPFALAVK